MLDILGESAQVSSVFIFIDIEALKYINAFGGVEVLRDTEALRDIEALRNIGALDVELSEMM